MPLFSTPALLEQPHFRTPTSLNASTEHSINTMCLQFVTVFQCGHQPCLQDACSEATKLKIDPSECEELQTVETTESGFCADCHKEMSATDDELERILQSTRLEWQKEFLDDESLGLLANMTISDADGEAKEQEDVARAIRESISSAYGSKFSLEDFRPDWNWTQRPSGYQVAESSTMGASRSAQHVPKPAVSLPRLKTKGLPPPSGPPPSRALPPTPAVLDTPQVQPEEGEPTSTPSPISPRSSPPPYSLFPPPSSPGRPSNAPDLIRGVPPSPVQSNPTSRKAGKARVGRDPPPVEPEPP